MKKALKICLSAALAVAAAFFSLLCAAAADYSTNEYGLGLSAKESGDELVVELKNNNDFEVSDVALGFEMSDELTADPAVGAPVSLGPGESIKAAVKQTAAPAVMKSARPDRPSKSETQGNTSASYITVIAAAAAVAVSAAILIKTKRGKKAAALVIAASLLIPTVNGFMVNAVGTGEKRSFELDAQTRIKGKASTVKMIVTYTANTAKGGAFELRSAVDGTDDSAVNDSAIKGSGTVTAFGKVERVEYEIRSAVDGYEPGESGEAILDGCGFSLDSLDLKLKPGDNRITLSAYLEDETKQTQTITRRYNNGSTYRSTPAEVKTQGEARYVENLVNIYFENGVTDGEADEIIRSAGGKRVGELYGARLFQAKIEAKDLDELKSICDELEKLDEVKSAQPELIFDFDDNTVFYPNDPFLASGTQVPWDEDYPSGNNWPQECLRAPSAWAYNQYYSNVKVGVVDSGFYPDHADFADDAINFPAGREATSSFDDDNATHGTHVSGLIVAEQNNGIGLAGMVPDVNAYCASYKSNSTVTGIVECFTEEVECGAKAVNLSLGLAPAPSSTYPNPYLSSYSQEELDLTAQECVAAMDSLLTSGYEFVVIQSAGNGLTDTRLSYSTSGKRSVDATRNGLFCSVKPQKYGSISANRAKACYDRIIVVGAVENLTNSEGAAFRMASFSNAGERVDVYAPGRSVYSTIPPTVISAGVVTNTRGYGGLSGTSQAAPLVAGIAALCFAAAPDLTGAEVKAIICDDANSEYVAHDNDDNYVGTPEDPDADLRLHPIEGDGKVASAYLCACAALETSRPLADYRILNNYVRIAARLDPNDYINYEVVQAVLDSIDYNIKDYRQDLVHAKAQELLAALDALQEKGPADYTSVDEAIAQAQALDRPLYDDLSAVDAAVAAVERGKLNDEQDAVDAMAHAILDAISALNVSCGLETTDGEVCLDEDKGLIVFTVEKVEDLSSFLVARNGWNIVLTQNELGTNSTGSKVTVTRGDYSFVYNVAVLGDVYGDGVVNAFDAYLINALPPDEDPYLTAADADCDGVIGSGDVELTEQAALLGDGIIINLYE